MRLPDKPSGILQLTAALIGIMLLHCTAGVKMSERSTEGGIHIQTDKQEYYQSDTITISISNRSDQEISSHIGSHTPDFAIKYVERKTDDGSWEQFYAHCQYPHCIFDTDAPQEIKPDQQKSMEWKPVIHINGTAETAPLVSGVYRLSILYLDQEFNKWKTEYSNHFTIK
jgi:hypothetical protein